MRIDVAHKGKITGLTFADENRLLSCGVDRNVKLWDFRDVDENGAGPSEVSSHLFRYSDTLLTSFKPRKPLSVFPGKTSFK